MEWSQDFESGLPEIDGQHRQVFALIQRVQDGVDHVAIREVLIELEQLARHHFDFEEGIMVEYEYPGMARHAIEHAALLREVHGYQDNVVFSPRRLNQVLGNWLQSHTVMEDRPLAQHVLQLRAGPSDVAMGAEFAHGVESSPQSAIQRKTDAEVKLAIGQ